MTNETYTDPSETFVPSVEMMQHKIAVLERDLELTERILKTVKAELEESKAGSRNRTEAFQRRWHHEGWSDAERRFNKSREHDRARYSKDLEEVRVRFERRVEAAERQAKEEYRRGYDEACAHIFTSIRTLHGLTVTREDDE